MAGWKAGRLAGYRRVAGWQARVHRGGAGWLARAKQQVGGCLAVWLGHTGGGCLALSLPCRYKVAPAPPPLSCRFKDAPASLVGRLDAVLAVIAECRGAQCADPYKDLHPGVGEGQGGLTRTCTRG